jgi:hypothetical protein
VTICIPGCCMPITRWDSLMVATWTIIFGYSLAKMDALWCLLDVSCTSSPNPGYSHTASFSYMSASWQLDGLKLLHWDLRLQSQTMNHDLLKLWAQEFQWEGMLEMPSHVKWDHVSERMHFENNEAWEIWALIYLFYWMLIRYTVKKKVRIHSPSAKPKSY